MLIGALACGCLLAMPLGFFVGASVENLNAPVGVSRSAMLGAFPAAVGALAGVLLLAPARVRDPQRLVIGTLVAGVLRSLASMLLALLVHAAAQPQTAPFLTSLVAALVLCTIAEITWVRAARRSSGVPDAGPSPAGN